MRITASYGIPRPGSSRFALTRPFPQLEVVFEQGYDAARSLAFYDTTLVWQWLRVVGDVIFAAGAVLMAVDFIAKVGDALGWGSRLAVPGRA